MNLQQCLARRNFNGARNTQRLFSAVRDVIPLKETDYEIQFVEGTTDRWKAQIYCSISSNDELKQFRMNYISRNDETIKISTNKKCSPASPYVINAYFRCHHDTRYIPTRDVTKIIELNPCKRFKNNNCEFTMSVKVFKKFLNFPCVIDIEWNHNHPIRALESVSFKSVSEAVSLQVKKYFENGLTPSIAHYEFVSELRRQCDTELEFHLRKADRSLCPRRRDFNALYRNFCDEMFGGKNGSLMFNELEQNLQKLKDNNDAFVDWKMYDSAQKEPLIVVLVTPMMCRVHSMVRQ